MPAAYAAALIRLILNQIRKVQFFINKGVLPAKGPSGGALPMLACVEVTGILKTTSVNGCLAI